MSWITDAGDHEGWVARILEDGRQAHGSTGRRRDDGSVEYVELVGVAGDPDGEEQVSSDRVVSWVPQCTCGWRGTIWERVTELHLADDAVQRGWRPLGEPGDEPPHVEEAAHAEWRRHLHDAAASVRQAAEAAAAYQRRLEQAVVEARRNGLSWEKIGEACGMTKQSAHERWATAERVASEADTAALGWLEHDRPHPPNPWSSSEHKEFSADNTVAPSGTDQDRPEAASDAGEAEPGPAESRPSQRGRKKQRPAGSRKRRSYTSAELDAYQLDKVRDEDGEILEYRVLVAGDTLGTIERAPYGHRGWTARDSNRIALPHRGGTGRHYARNREEAVIDLLMGIGITTGR